MLGESQVQRDAGGDSLTGFRNVTESSPSWRPRLFGGNLVCRTSHAELLPVCDPQLPLTCEFAFTCHARSSKSGQRHTCDRGNGVDPNSAKSPVNRQRLLRAVALPNHQNLSRYRGRATLLPCATWWWAVCTAATDRKK